MQSARRARRLVCLVVLAVCARSRAAYPEQAPHAWDSMELPGPAAALAAAVGLDPATPRARLLLEVVRVAHAAPPGQSAEVDAVRSRLEAWLATVGSPQESPAATGHPAVDPSGPAELSVPQPLPEATWRDVLGLQGDTPGTLATALLWDRSASLLYFGLMATDARTREFLRGHPKLLTRIYLDHAAAFAAFGRSLHVVDGRMSLPGGSDARLAWEDIVGASPEDPDAFIRAVLGRHQGRFAFFLDTVTHLDEPRRAFALARTEGANSERRERLTALVRLFTDLHPEWRIADRPFHRPPLDGPLVLLTLSVTEEGQLAPPSARWFWNAVFSGEGVPPDGPRRAAALTSWKKMSRADAEPADAVWMLERILGPAVETGRERLCAVSFVQRLFRDVPPERLWEVVVVARGFIEARTMVVALERLGVTDVSLFARAVDHALRLSAISPPAAAASSLVQFQSVCVVLERLRVRGVLDRDTAVALVGSLLDVPLGDDGRYRGGLVRWMRDTLLPLLGAAPGVIDEAEQVALEALAGEARGVKRSGVAPRVIWEGVEYNVDVAGAELARLERVRDRQLGNRLDDAFAFVASIDRLETGTTPDAVGLACDALVRQAGTLQPVSWPAPGIGAAVTRISDLVEPLCVRIRRHTRSARDSDAPLTSTFHSVSGRTLPAPAAGAVADLLAIGDAVFADTTAAIVYALHVGEPAGAVDLAPDIARRHRFLLDERDPARRARGAWGLPEEQLGAGQPWHVTGSLLGLEHGLGKLALRFLFGEMPSPPRMNDNERRTIALGLALLNPLALEDRDRDAIVEALSRGRARLASPDAVAADLDAIATTAGWSEWRRETVSWAAACDPASLPALLTLTDYFWTGIAQPGAPPRLDAWGPPTTPLDGDLRLAWPLARPWEELAGRAASGQLATRFVDMTLRVAEALKHLDLPASLAAGTLAPALADLIHEAPLGHADDWYALAAYASRLPDERLLEYIAALAAGGPLVPADETRPHRPGP